MRGDIDRIWSMRLAGFDAAWELTLAGQVLTRRDPERLFSGASMVKTLLAALVDEDVRAGVLGLSRSVPVTRDALVGEDGLLRFGQIPTMHRLSDLVLLMIAVSDNTATNALLAFLGGAGAVNSRFTARGWASAIHGPVGVGTGPLSHVCLEDHQAALAGISEPLIRAAFSAQQDRRALARCVAYGAEFRHKTGTVDGLRHDAGVLVTPRGPLWVGALCDGGPVSEWVDHPACLAMGAAMRESLSALGLAQLLAA